jgi:hypothetical protein
LFSIVGGTAAVVEADGFEKAAVLSHFDRKDWKASKPPAITARTTVILTNFRPVRGVIDSLGATSSARLIPSGVISNAQVRTTAIGNPMASPRRRVAYFMACP